MRRLLKEELYRLFHSLYIYAFPAVLALMFIYDYANGNGRGSVGGFIHFYSSGSTMTMESFLRDFMPEYLPLAFLGAALVMVYLWGRETKTGYIKNIAGNFKGRHVLVIAKMITGSIAILFNTFFTVIYEILVVTVLQDKKLIRIAEYTLPLDKNEMPEITRKFWVSQEQWTSERVSELHSQYLMILLWILAGIALISLLLMLHELFRSAIPGYIFAIGIAGTRIIEGLIIQIFSLLLGNADIGRFMIIYQFSFLKTMTFDEAVGDYVNDYSKWPSWVCTIAYIVVFFGISIYLSRKKDVK